MKIISKGALALSLIVIIVAFRDLLPCPRQTGGVEGRG